MNFSNLKVRTRLALGFSLLLVLIVAVALVALQGMRTVDRLTDEVIQVGLANERLVREWLANTEGNTMRTLAAAKSHDTEVVKYFLRQIEERSKRGAELQAKLDKGLTEPAARALLDEIAARRAEYRAAREAFFKNGATEDPEVVLVPKLNAFVASMGKLQAFQTNVIDLAAGKIQNQYEDSRGLLLGLTALAMLLGAVGAVVVSASIVGALGGELQYAMGVTDHIADGKLDTEVRLKPDDRSSLLYAIASMRDRLTGIIGNVREGASSIASASQQIAEANQDLARRTEQQAGALEETAASIEQLSAAVGHTARQAEESSQLSQNAVGIAKRGAVVVEQVVQTMSAIDHSSKRIVEIISVIDSIAFQTNILALNAAVEAARAGEEGRGFAVVASEVRSLAQRSSSAAKEIKDLINDSVVQVAAGNALVGEAGASMAEILQSIDSVLAMMREISRATAEQTTGVGQINQVILELDGLTQQNATLVEEAATATEALKGQAMMLDRMFDVFSLGAHQGRVRPKAPKTLAPVKLAA